MSSSSARDLTAFILAGGRSTRMGTDKAFLQLEGRTLLARALTLARSVTSEVQIVGSHEKFAPFAPVVQDVFRDHGPLGGVHAALRASPAELNLILAVDTPFIPLAFLQYLVSQAREARDAVVVVPRVTSWQPLCAVYRRDFATLAEHALRAGQNRIDRLFDEIRTRVIGEQELEAAGFSSAIFHNLNAPEDLQAENRSPLTGF